MVYVLWHFKMKNLNVVKSNEPIIQLETAR